MRAGVSHHRRRRGARVRVSGRIGITVQAGSLFSFFHHYLISAPHLCTLVLWMGTPYWSLVVTVFEVSSFSDVSPLSTNDP